MSNPPPSLIKHPRGRFGTILVVFKMNGGWGMII